MGLFGIVFSCSCQIHVKYLLNLFHQVSDRVQASLNPLVSTPFASYYHIISYHIIIIGLEAIIKGIVVIQQDCIKMQIKTKAISTLKLLDMFS